MSRTIPRVVIAGTAGDSGKTLVSLSILVKLRHLGIPAAAFKKGPDFIDTAWLGLAAGAPVRNLDVYLTESGYVRRTFTAHAAPGGVNIIEGNRGLYDGMETGENSTAELAKTLKSPVILVCSPVKTTRTAAAGILGCQRFDPDVDIAGIILNKIAGTRHESVVRKAVEETCGIPVVGSIPKLIDSDVLPSRHLGLVMPEEIRDAPGLVDRLYRVCDEHIDLDAVIEIAGQAPPLPVSRAQRHIGGAPSRVRIGYFYDSVFTFYYPENLEALQKAGAELIKISSLSDTSLPAVDALYIGGGFPETHRGDLEKNSSMRYAVKKAAESGMPIYAECGGLVYLTQSLRWKNESYAMAGVFPVGMEMYGTPQGHGYCEVKVDRENPFFALGTTYRGHEFHYTGIVSGFDRVKSAYAVTRGVGCFNGRDGLVYKNVLAGYMHPHAGGAGTWAQGIVKTAVSSRERNKPAVTVCGRI